MLRRSALLISLLISVSACVRPYAGGGAPAYDASSGAAATPAAEGMEAQVRNLEERLETAHGESEQMVSQLREDVIALNKRMDELQRQVDQMLKPSPEAGMSLAAPSAGSVQELQDRLNELTNKYNAVIYVLRERGILVAEPDRSNVPAPAASSTITPSVSAAPATPKELYDRAYEDYKNGKVAEAREQFIALIAAHPDSEFSDNAQYWIGECRYSTGEYEAAIGEFAKLIKTYPKSNKICRATLKIGYAFAELKKKEEAATAFDKVIATCGDSEESRLAKKKKDLLR